MKHSYLLAGTKLNQLFRLIFRYGISLHPRYIIRFLFLLQNGVWSSFLSFAENTRYKKRLKSFQPPDDPIFIIGHWRTGSTFLHQILNLDEQLIAPSVFQVSMPDHFLLSRRYYKPIMTRMLDTVRPMDSVKLGFDEPQEDEYALLKMGIRSPLEKLIFPKNDDFFLTGTKSLIPDEKDLYHWIEKFRLFHKKLVFQTGKRVVFKNPFHSLRIDLLKEVFPNAFFIYIYRNPYVVIPSTRRMWSIVGKQNCLKRYRCEPSMEAITKVYKTINDSINSALNRLPENRYYEVKFEDYEKNPLQSINMLYKHMGKEMSSFHKQAIMSFLEENRDFRKNHYALSEDEVSLIEEELKDELDRTGYKNPY